MIVKTEKLYCDICQSEVNSFADIKSNRDDGTVLLMQKKTWKKGACRVDICRKCSNEILEFIDGMKFGEGRSKWKDVEK